MRRLLGVATVLTILMLLSTVALAGSGYFGKYRDEFNAKSFSGSDGTEYWGDDPWKEIGEEDGPGDGLVHVDSDGDCVASKCLHIFSEGKYLDGVGAVRYADTSVFYQFELSYEVRFKGTSETGATLVVEKSVDGGDVWYQLNSFDLSEPFTAHPTHNIGSYDSMITKFVVRGDLIGDVFIDDVELKGELVEPPPTNSTSSTTTTTKPTTTTTKRPTTTTTVETTTTTTTTIPNDTTTSSTTTTTQPTTTTTTPETTTTSEVAIGIGGDDEPGDGGTPPDGGGIRQTARGIQASFDGQLFGDMPELASISGVDHQADYRMATEVIEASWAWLVILALILAWSIVSGLERRQNSTES